MRILIAFALMTTSAAAQDGLYRLNDSWSCTNPGMDGGAIEVRFPQLHMVETACTLTNPTPIRGMRAYLYDADCSGEGDTWTERYLLMPSFDDSLVILRDGVATTWQRCR